MDLQELGFEIKTLRKQKGWSQDVLEQYSGITKRTISKIDNGFIKDVISPQKRKLALKTFFKAAGVRVYENQTTTKKIYTVS